MKLIRRTGIVLQRVDAGKMSREKALFGLWTLVFGLEFLKLNFQFSVFSFVRLPLFLRAFLISVNLFPHFVVSIHDSRFTNL